MSFTTTLHVINSGVIKLARIQPAADVYRGMRGKQLPKAMKEMNAFGVRGGVECGFMSATMDEDMARQYAGGGDARALEDDTEVLGMVFKMRMGLVDRGAMLGWISQYPNECKAGLQNFGDRKRALALELQQV